MSNLDTALEYTNQLVGEMRYGWWTSGEVPEGAPANAVNKRYPSVQDLKGKRIFCLTGDAMMRARGVEKSYRRVYSGEVVTIQTASGKRLAGTPNHPVLTDKGWLPLKSIRKGTNVLSSPSLGQLAGPDKDDNDEPIALEQMHRSLANTGKMERHSGTPLDFHGDWRDGEVDVVIPESVLRDDFQAPSGEQFVKLGLSDAASTDAALAVAGASDKVAVRVSTPPGFMGGANLSQSFRGCQPGILDLLGFGNTSQYTSVSEPILDGLSGDAVSGSNFSASGSVKVLANDSIGIQDELVSGRGSRASISPIEASAVLDATEFEAGVPQAALDAGSAHSELLGDLSHGLPAAVSRDKVIGVDVRAFSGNVFNLQTESGIYIANGIMSHNCAGVGNLMRRRVGKTIPTYGNPDFDGGTLAWVTFYQDFLIPFSLDRVKRGDLLLRPFRDSIDQGHWALALGGGPDAHVLQSFAYDGAGNPGLNQTYTVRASHDGGYYRYIVRAEDWIDHDKSTAEWAK